jgi:ketosteroid isomerase-like protein
MTRAEDIAAMLASPKDARYTTDDIRVQFYGNTAIVTGCMTATHTGIHDSYGLRWRWIDLFLKHNGRWQIISTTQVD